MTTTKTKRSMSASHKAAIAAGRIEGATVKRYLDAISTKGKPGRPVDPRRAERKLGEIDKQLQREENPLTRLELEQTRIDLTNRLQALRAKPGLDIPALEAEFVKVAKSYSERKGISYAAFRKVGVPADTLRRAGIRRSA
jgi:hypothetical protein